MRDKQNEIDLWVKTFRATACQMWVINTVQKLDYRSYNSKVESLTKIMFRLIGKIRPFYSKCISRSLKLNSIFQWVLSFLSFTKGIHIVSFPSILIYSFFFSISLSLCILKQARDVLNINYWFFNWKKLKSCKHI